MCIMLWYYDNKKFILLFNREEYTARETKKLDVHYEAYVDFRAIM